MTEDRAKLSAKERNALPDSSFAYIDEKGERHFPIHNKAHVIAALRLGPRSPMWGKAKGKVMAAAKKYGVDTDADAGRSFEALLPEVRYIQDTPEVRTTDGGPTTISGYASVFNRTSRRLGNFHEQVMPGAFDTALRGLADGNVVCRYNHKDDMVLGTTHAGTLRLAVDERGLKYEVDPPRHRADVLELVERGDVRYSSFAFRVAAPGEDDEWGEDETGMIMRRLKQVELVDVAPVLDPAYKDTTAMARNMSGAVESLALWVDADPSEVRSMLEEGKAHKFFRKTGQVIPKLDKQASSDREDARALDDEAVSLRHRKDEPVEGDYMVPEDERSIRSEEEIRAAMKPRDISQLCMRFHHGEPCVRPAGHAADGPQAADGGHAGLCWGRHDGLHCNQHDGHEGAHTPMTVASRDAGEEDTEQRAEPEVTTLTAPEAMRKMLERKKGLTALPE